MLRQSARILSGQVGGHTVTDPMVDSPPHYTHFKGFETIDVMEQAYPNDPLLFMATKYLLRAPFKGSFEQDLKKCIWYIERRLSQP